MALPAVTDDDLDRLAGTQHPGVASLLRFFHYQHLSDDLQAISAPCAAQAFHMASILPSNAELTTGLRKLLEAKDCFVRAAL